MEFFFRGAEDGTPLAPFSPVHLLLLAIFVLGFWLIGRSGCPRRSIGAGSGGQTIPASTGLRDPRRARRFSVLLAGILLTDQIVLYAWQFGSGFFQMALSLPLFHCRIAIWLLIIGVLGQRKTILRVGMCWGAAGALLAMLVPDLYNFRFPHYTNFQFFIGHMVMGWLIFHLLWHERERIGRHEIRAVVLISTLYNVAMLGVNIALRPHFPAANYGYMMELPALVPIHLPIALHFPLMLALFAAIMVLIGLLFEKIGRRAVSANQAQLVAH